MHLFSLLLLLHGNVKRPMLYINALLIRPCDFLYHSEIITQNLFFYTTHSWPCPHSIAFCVDCNCITHINSIITKYNEVRTIFVYFIITIVGSGPVMVQKKSITIHVQWNLVRDTSNKRTLPICSWNRVQDRNIII